MDHLLQLSVVPELAMSTPAACSTKYQGELTKVQKAAGPPANPLLIADTSVVTPANPPAPPRPLEEDHRPPWPPPDPVQNDMMALMPGYSNAQGQHMPLLAPVTPPATPKEAPPVQEVAVLPVTTHPSTVVDVRKSCSHTERPRVPLTAMVVSSVRVPPWPPDWCCAAQEQGASLPPSAHLPASRKEPRCSWLRPVPTRPPDQCKPGPLPVPSRPPAQTHGTHFASQVTLASQPRYERGGFNKIFAERVPVMGFYFAMIAACLQYAEIMKPHASSHGLLVASHYKLNGMLLCLIPKEESHICARVSVQLIGHSGEVSRICPTLRRYFVHELLCIDWQEVQLTIAQSKVDLLLMISPEANVMNGLEFNIHNSEFNSLSPTYPGSHLPGYAKSYFADLPWIIAWSQYFGWSVIGVTYKQILLTNLVLYPTKFATVNLEWQIAWSFHLGSIVCHLSYQLFHSAPGEAGFVLFGADTWSMAATWPCYHLHGSAATTICPQGFCAKLVLWEAYFSGPQLRHMCCGQLQVAMAASPLITKFSQHLCGYPDGLVDQHPCLGRFCGIGWDSRIDVPFLMHHLLVFRSTACISACRVQLSHNCYITECISFQYSHLFILPYREVWEQEKGNCTLVFNTKIGVVTIVQPHTSLALQSDANVLLREGINSFFLLPRGMIAPPPTKLSDTGNSLDGVMLFKGLHLGVYKLQFHEYYWDPGDSLLTVLSRPRTGDSHYVLGYTLQGSLYTLSLPSSESVFFFRWEIAWSFICASTASSTQAYIKLFCELVINTQVN